MDKLKKILEKQNQIWVVVVGIALIVFGIYQFLQISEMEKIGQTVRMKKVFEYIYNYGGKHTLLAIFETIGVIALISGILQLKNKL